MNLSYISLSCWTITGCSEKKRFSLENFKSNFWPKILFYFCSNYISVLLSNTGIPLYCLHKNTQKIQWKSDILCRQACSGLFRVQTWGNYEGKSWRCLVCPNFLLFQRKQIIWTVLKKIVFKCHTNHLCMYKRGIKQGFSIPPEMSRVQPSDLKLLHYCMYFRVLERAN